MSGALLQTFHERHPHHFFNAMATADVIVHACAWSDGGAEFVYGDGTVLSFCDDMNTFVALRGSSSNTGQSNDVSVERDMLFTAWTLSKYTAKVTAALALYNHYSPQPRLIAHLLAEPVQLWCAETPMDSLVLAKDARLLERRTLTLEGHEYTSESNELVRNVPVRRTVRVGTELTLWCALRRVSLTLHASRLTFTVRWPAPVTQADTQHSPLYTTTQGVQPSSAVNNGVGVVECVPRSVTPMATTLARMRGAYFVWLEQTFLVTAPPPAWAAMLRLALELDAEHKEGDDVEERHGEKDKHSGITNDDNNNNNCTTRAGKHEDCDVVRQDPLLTCTTSAPNASDTAQPAHAHDSCYDGGDHAPLLHGFLPPTASATVTPCRFSPIQPMHLHYLLARSNITGHDTYCTGSPLSTATTTPASTSWTTASTKGAGDAEDVMAAIHGAGATVRWRYDADVTNHPPHAMHWCVPVAADDGDMPALDAPLPLDVIEDREHGTSVAGTLNRTMVVTVVREDESVICTMPFRAGYLVQHQRCRYNRRTSVMAEYIVSSDGQTGLPPRLPALRLPRRYLLAQPRMQIASKTDALHAGEDTQPDKATCEVNRDDMVEVVIDATAQLARRNRMSGSCAYYAVGYEVVDMAFFAAQTRGRYLRPVVAMAVSLLQHSAAVRRRTEARQFAMHNTSQASHESPCLSHPPPPSQGSGTSNDEVTYCHTHVDHVGDFVALTNGTIRCCFTDRTLLTLIPGRHVWDEQSVLVTSLTRDATRSTMRLTQCTPHHPLAPYIDLALSFRRHVLHEAATRAASAEACTTSPQSPSPLPASQGGAGGDVHTTSPQAWCVGVDDAGSGEVNYTLLRCKIDQLLQESRQVARVNRSLLLDDDDDDGGGWCVPPS